MVVWLAHYDTCHGCLPWHITVIVVSIGKVHETERALESPLEKLNFGWEHSTLFTSDAPSMHERKLITVKVFIKIQWQPSWAYCGRSPWCRRKRPFLCMLIQRAWPPRGFQVLSVTYPLATCVDGCQLGCTSTLSFAASVSRFLFWQKQINPNFKRRHLVPYNKKR